MPKRPKFEAQKSEIHADHSQDPRHNPERALALIKAAHRGGGRPADVRHTEDVRDGWVQFVPAEEVIVTRHGKTGFRRIGVNHGQLRKTSSLERKLQQLENAYLKELSRFARQDDAAMLLAAHSENARGRAVATRKAQASKIEALVIEMFRNSNLPVRSRASAIVRQLKLNDVNLTARRVRQILSAKFRPSA